MFRDRALVRRWFDGHLPVHRALSLFARMRGDARIRKEFEIRAHLETILSGPKGATLALTHFEKERIEDLVVARTLSRRDPRSEVRRPWLVLAPVATVLVLALLVPLIWLLWPTRSEEGRTIPEELFAVRGVSQPYQNHVFLFCVRGQGDQTRFHRLDRPPIMATGMDACSLGGEFQFGLTNLGSEFGYVYILGIAEGDRRQWYYPRPGRGESISIPAGAREQLLGESLILRINHREGRLRVFAIFSKRPVSDEEIDRALGIWRAQPDSRTLPLGRDDIVVESFSLLLEIEGDSP